MKICAASAVFKPEIQISPQTASAGGKFCNSFNIEHPFALLQGAQGETGGRQDRGVYSLWMQRMFWLTQISLEVFDQIVTGSLAFHDNSVVFVQILSEDFL